MSATRGHDLVRVLFQIEPDAWHGSVTERLWAEPIGHGRFRLQNTPFFAFGVSFLDVVFGEERDGELVFSGISLRGGHSTYRLMPMKERRGEFSQYWTPLEDLGCSYEEEGRVLAVDVPPNANIYKIYDLLEEGHSANVWDFEEGHCGHPLLREAPGCAE